MNKIFKNLPGRRILIRKLPHFDIRRKFIFIFLGLIFLLLTMTVLLRLTLSSDIIKVTEDHLSCVSGNDLEIWANTEKINLILNESLLKDKLKKRYNCIETIQKSWSFPFNVSLLVSGRKAVAQITEVKKNIVAPDLEDREATSSSQEAKPLSSPQIVYGNSFLVDGEGVLFAIGDSHAGVKNINFLTQTEFTIGQSLPKNSWENALLLIHEMEKNGFGNMSIEIEDDKLTLKGKEEYIFSLHDDYTYQVASLQLILQKAKMNSKSVEKVDLRFNKPIVVYTPEKKR